MDASISRTFNNIADSHSMDASNAVLAGLQISKVYRGLRNWTSFTFDHSWRIHSTSQKKDQGVLVGYLRSKS